MIKGLSYEQAAAWLLERDEFLILTHVRPDGDTVGCAAGLCHALREQGKRAFVLPNPEMTSLFTPYLDGMWAEESYEPKAVVAVDMAALGMFPENARCYQERVDLSIDHHNSQEFYAKQTCLDGYRAACGELVYDIIRQWGPVSRNAAQALYVAVSTDTGCFMYSNTTADTHRVAAALMETGIPTASLNKLHFRTKSVKRMKLESALIEGMELYENGTIAIVTQSLELMERLEATQRDAEDISSLVGQLEGVKTSITLRELKPGVCKLSVRTDPADLNASEVCAVLGGGGHPAAAGATVAKDIPGTKDAILSAIRQVRESM